MQICKVTASTARNPNFFARRFGMINQKNPAFGMRRTHHSRSARTYYQSVVFHGAGLHGSE
jgi:hypothetical protein